MTTLPRLPRGFDDADCEHHSQIDLYTSIEYTYLAARNLSFMINVPLLQIQRTLIVAQIWLTPT